jgi:hypothetical protein
MNVSEVMVQYLKAAGVGHVFGYPGDPNIEFMEAARRAGMKFVLGRREGTAGLERPIQFVCITFTRSGHSIWLKSNNSSA